VVSIRKTYNCKRDPVLAYASFDFEYDMDLAKTFRSYDHDELGILAQLENCIIIFSIKREEN